eukprot:TRINITY_DN13145_c0_g1_i1.p1 TRINITY_DN13145_c0_g1~~TRINITY_DN13145_c0_g1_i1.p1  ORF type:complete len:339 (-),score=52.97 TRINITY_DN13145_c0_g1_i1:30-1046(-)
MFPCASKRISQLFGSFEAPITIAVVVLSFAYAGKEIATNGLQNQQTKERMEKWHRDNTLEPDPDESAKLFRFIHDRIDHLLPLPSKEDLSDTLNKTKEERLASWKRAIDHSIARLIAGIISLNLMIMYVHVQINILQRYKCFYQLSQRKQIQLPIQTLHYLPLSEELKSNYINKTHRHFLEAGILDLSNLVREQTVTALEDWTLDRTAGPKDIQNIVQVILDDSFKIMTMGYNNKILSYLLPPDLNQDPDSNSIEAILEDETRFLIERDTYMFKNQLQKSLNTTSESILSSFSKKELLPFVKWVPHMKKSFENFFSENTLPSASVDLKKFGEAMFLAL